MTNKQNRQSKKQNRDAFFSAHAGEYNCVNFTSDSIVVPALRSFFCKMAYTVDAKCVMACKHKKLNEKDLTHRGNMTIPQCDICTRNVYVRPQWFMIPGALRGLHKSEVEVISPLSVHQGDGQTFQGFHAKCKHSNKGCKT